jgi:hypothetical protein
VEPDEVDIFTFAMFRNLEQVDDAEEARRARQLRGDIEETDRFDGIDFDLAFVHRVAVADLHVRTGPDADATGDFALPDPLAQTFRKDQDSSLRPPSLLNISVCAKRYQGFRLDFKPGR